MVELKQLAFGGINALGIRVNLPRGDVHFIVRNQMILCDDCVNIECLLRRYPTLCIIQCAGNGGMVEMVEEKVIKCSDEASKLGVCLGMKALDVFTFL